MQWPKKLHQCLPHDRITQHLLDRNLSKWTCLVNLPSSNLCWLSVSIYPSRAGTTASCSSQQIQPDSLTQMYSSSMIYGSLNRSYWRFIHIRGAIICLSEWITLLPKRHSFHNITEFCGGHITVADVREVFLVILSFGSFEFLHSSADSYCWPGHQDWNDHFSNRAHIGAWNNFLMNCISR